MNNAFEIRKVPEYKWLTMRCHPDLHGSIMEIIKGLDVAQYAEILILAAWTGAFDLRLYDQGYINITAVEIDLAGYANDREKIKRLVGLDLNADFADAIGWKYDLIIAMEIIEHLENPRHFLSEMRNLLRDENSLILISTPNVHDVSSRINFAITGHPSFFLSVPWLHDHITPIMHNVMLHLVPLSGLSLVTTRSVNSYVKHVLYYYSPSVRIVAYVLWLAFLYPLFAALCILNGNISHWANICYVLKRR